MEFDIDIAIECPHWEELDFDISKTTVDTIKEVCNSGLSHKKHIEISIVLVDDPFIRALNKKYRNKDKPTNVLSFPLTELDEFEATTPFISLGDVIISYDTIKVEASEQNKSIQDHFTHMLVHGCLHLMHYDHIEDEEAQIMETLEIEILQRIGVKNPYAIA